MVDHTQGTRSGSQDPPTPVTHTAPRAGGGNVVAIAEEVEDVARCTMAPT